MRHAQFLLVVLPVMSACEMQAAEETAVSKGKQAAELSWSMRYDDAGRITSITDPAGRKTTVAYGVDEKKCLRTVTRIHADGTKVTWDLDQFGRRVGMTDAADTVRYTYDRLGRLATVCREGHPAIAYGYDTFDRLTAISLGGGLDIRYAFDFLGRLARIETPAGPIIFEYQTGLGKIIRTLPNGIRTVWEYRPDGLLGSITHVAKDDAVLLQFTYAYRPDGLIGAINEWSPQGEKAVKYQYDTSSRLMAVDDPRAGKIACRYDKCGNRIELRAGNDEAISSVYDWMGRIVRQNGHNCTHDAMGNLTAEAAKGGNRTFAYGAMSLLESARTDKGKVQYRYDGDGYLLARIGDSKTTSFISDPTADVWHPLLATNADGKHTLYIWEGDVPLAAIEGKTVRFFLHDHLGSIRCLADGEGKIIERLDYGPFGEPRQEASGTALRPGFAGLFYDPVALLYLTQARAYDPRLGRFLQRDPEGLITVGCFDLSSYAYCGNDPVNFRDVTGSRRVAVQYNYAWGLARNFFIELPETISEGTRGVVDFWKPSNIAAGFRQGFELGRPSPGTWAEQAERYGGPLARDAVQGILTHTLLTEIDIALGGLLPKTYIPIGKAGHLGVGERAYYGAPHLGLIQRTVAGSTQTKAVLHLYGAKAFVSLGDLRFSIPYSLLAFLPRSSDGESASTSSGRRSIIDQADLFHLLPDQRHWYGGGPPRGGGGGGFSPFSSSNVGGVYLRGAGDALKHLGRLSGVAVDDKNGRLVLVAEGKDKIDLPPLRMDDVVTVFRSVYQHGEAPFVSIDPDSQNPRGPIMLVRHGEATANTYVGWVLFEADRVMKAYSLGRDNVTRQEIKSTIEGYRNLLDLGFSNFDKPQMKSNWERFWIVPAEVNRRQTANKQLTLLDVSLQVNTQRMELRDGKLAPAAEDTPSREGRAFSEWFTKHYDDLAQEARSQPPKASGIDTAVRFFAELRRIALVTAIAETLRDQGVPLPGWMQDYPVRPCPVAPATPAIVVEAAKTKTSRVVEGDSTRTLKEIRQHRIYGGVRLSASDKDVHTQTGASVAEDLLPVMLPAIAAVPTLSPVSCEKDGKPYQAVALPGSNTRDVGACRLEEVDMVVPVQAGTELRLVRVFHSFFQPNDVLGNGWTFDLPRLQRQYLPVERTGDQAKYKTVHQLTSPLATWSEVFSKVAHVPEVDAHLQVPEGSPEMLGLADTKDDKIGQATQVLAFRDGRRWHFDDAGDLAAWTDGPLTVIYRHDQGRRIRRIEGWYGDHLRADIRLQHDSLGRLISARGSNDQTAEFLYDDAGRLTKTVRAQGISQYKYQQGLLTGLARNGKIVREFEYDERGRLLRDRYTGGSETVYQVRPSAEGVEITSATEDLRNRQKRSASAQYDPALRPLSRVFEDGTQIQWRYGPGGEVEATITSPDGRQISANRSADVGRIAWRLPEGAAYSAQFDKAGRISEVRQDDRLVVQQQWHPAGPLALALYETVALHPEYDKQQAPTGLVVTPPEKGPEFSQWLHVGYDELGRPAKVTDYSGSEIQIGYDKTGELAALASKRGGIAVEREASGQVKTVKTSWGYRQTCTYQPKTRELEELKVAVGESEAVTQFEHGQPARVRQFDGGQYTITYYDQGAHQGLPKQISTPDKAALTYQYDSAGRPAVLQCDDVYRQEFTYDPKGRLTDVRYMRVGE